MGVLFWPLLMGLALISFVVYDAFCRSGGWGLFVSPVILFQLDRLFMFSLNGDNLAGVIGSLLRGYPQSLLLYAGMFLFTAIVTSPFARVGGTHLRPSPTSRHRPAR